MLKRLLSILLVAAMLIGFFPAGVITVAHAEETAEKGEIDKSTLEMLGFTISADAPEESYLGPGNTTMAEKSELYLNYGGFRNYGWMLRENLNLYHNWSSYENYGAYKLYGEYHNGDWADLEVGNGYTYGTTGGQASVIGSNVRSANAHLNRNYETSVEYRSASGKNDRVAQLYVVSAKDRVDFTAYLEIIKFNKNSDGTYSEQVIRSVRLSDALEALDEAGMFYNQSFDALFEITAGDFNGDGLDEIAVYYGTNEVKIYTTKNDTLSLWKTIDFNNEGILDSSKPISDPITTDFKEYGHEVYRAAIVTLNAGDLKKDFTEDLVITVSMPQGSTEYAHQNYSNAHIYGANSEDKSVSASEFTKDLTVKLTTDNLQGNTDNPQVFKAANAAIGDLDGDNCMELVIGGRLVKYNGGMTHMGNVGGLITVEYNQRTRQYSVSNAFQTELKEYDEDKILLNKVGDDIDYYAPVGMAVADLDGVGDELPYLFFFSGLFTYESGSYTDTKHYLDTIKNMTNNANENTTKNDHWISDVVVGNLNNSDSGAQQLIAVIGCRGGSKKRVDDTKSYWYYMSYISRDGDGNVYKACEGILNAAYSDSNTAKYNRPSPFVSIALPDVDNDSIVLEYLSTDVVYTSPEIQAILQSVPYFQDVADVYDDYLANGETGYGVSSGSGSGATASVEASLGVYCDAELSIGVSAEIESEIAATTSYGYASTTTVETSTGYASEPGDDYAVMYVIPYYRHTYNATYPDGTTNTMVIEDPMVPSVITVPVDTYDAIAAVTQGMEPIRGNILTSTPGDPASYQDAPKGNWIPIGDPHLLTNSGNSSTNVSISQSVSDEYEHSFSVGISQSFQMGFGGGILGNDARVGFTEGFAVAGGGVFSNMEGVEYSCIVDNLPAGVGGYAFNWQFGISETTLNGEDIIVVGFQTSNVKQAPNMPKDLTVTEITSNTIALEWGVPSDSALFEVFASRDQDTWLPLDPVPATMADDEDIMTYVVTDLSPGTTYYFKVNSSDARGVRSLDSSVVMGTTLGNEGTFSIVSQPKDTSAAKGKDATFSIAVSSDSKSTIYYQWMYSDGKGWTNISNSNSPTLTVRNVTEDMDGRMYRCRVSQSANYFYSQNATLTVSKTPVDLSLSVTNNGATIPDGGTVQATYTSTVDVTEDITVWNDIVSDGYTKVTPNQFVTEGDNSYEYSSSAVYFWKDASNNIYSDADNTVGEKLTVSYRFTDENNSYITDSSTSTVDGVAIYELDDEGKAVSAGTATVAYAPKDEGGKYVYVIGSTYYVSTGTTGTVDGNEVEIYAAVSMDTDIIYYNNVEYPVASMTNVKAPSTEKTVVGQNTQTTEGDKLTLTASGLPTDLTDADKVYFRITHKATGTSFSIPAVKSGSDYVAEYTFVSTGVYEITATFNGNEVYFSGESNAITLYVNGATAMMTLGGGSMTYGNSLHLAPVIHSASGKSTPGNVTYEVRKDGKTVSGLISGNIFTPTQCGEYTVTATCTIDGTKYEASSNITVNARTLTITANSVSASLSDTEQERTAMLSASVSGLLNSDAHLLSYDLRSSATTASVQGSYRIDVNVTSDRAALESKYNLVLVSGTFTLDQSSVRLYAEAVANGSVSISYTTTVSDSNGTYTSSPLTVESGALIPMGSTVVITAKPNSGFGVEKWMINGVQNASTDTTYVIDNLQTAQDIKIYFTQTYNTLNFSGTEGGGTVTGAYAGSNSSFASGDRINVNQSVVLTAKPAEGYAVKYWSCDGEIIKAENGVDNYTGLTYTVTGISKTTTYFVAFEKVETAEVKVTFVDKDGYPFLGASVNINGEDLSGDENIFTYTTTKHQNLVISISVPSNMLIDHWELNGKVAANAVEVMNIHDLSGDMEFIVYCTTPNQRVLTFGTELIETNGGSVDQAGTIQASRSGTDVASGASLPQGAVITLTAHPAEGYRIAKWTVNGSQVAGTDVSTYQIALDMTSEVKVYFEKKPVVAVTDNTAGKITLQIGSSTINSGDFAEFGDDVQVNIEPNAGFVVDTVTVNGSDVTAMLHTSGDIRYYTIEDITNNTEIAVTYKAKPVVSFTSENGACEITATKDFAEGEIASGSYVDFGSDLNGTIIPAAGYVVDAVTVNGTAIAFAVGTDSDTVTFVVNDVQTDTEIVVSYKAKPIITIDNEDLGDVTITATKDFAEGEIASGSYVDFGTVLNGTVSPDFGYVVASVKVDSIEVALTAVANSDDVTFHVPEILTNTVIEVAYAAIDTTAVSFGIIDKNGADTEGGMDGTISASVDRKGMESYAVTDDSGILETVYSGSTVTFTAVPDAGYNVSKWFLNGEEVSNQPTLTITDDMVDQHVEVQFDLVGQQILYSITGMSDKAELDATFTPSGGNAQTFPSGNRPTTNGVVTLTVINLDPNYEVEGWYVNGEKQEGQNGLVFEYQVTVDVGAEISVNLVRCSYPVTFSAVEGTVTASAGENPIASGDILVGDTEITFTATPAEPTGYTFQYWLVNGEISEVTEETLTLILTEDLDVQAVYKLDFVRYTVTYGVVDTNGEEEGGLNGTLMLDSYRFSPARVRAGSNLTFIAAPDADYRVEGWYADAEGTMPIDGTTLEQLTYSTENLVADMTVYVKFEPIPEYTINIAVTGLGTVAATVNGMPAEITDGTLVVQRYDDVVLTAVPNDNQHLTGWTLDGESVGNNLTLTLESVTADIAVTADFQPSQTVEFICEVIDGSADVESGFGDDLAPIDPPTGVMINKGQNVVIEVTPDEGKMLDKWVINGEELVDYLDHTYIIDSIDQDTLVQVFFVDEMLHSIPEDNAECFEIVDITETPEEYGNDRQIRDRGDVTFVVKPVQPFVITNLVVDGGEGSTSQVIPNENGTWTVIIENVRGDITFTEITYASCFYRTEETLTSGGTYILTLGGNEDEVGTYTFNQVSGGWTIQAADGKYLALESKALVSSDTAFTWTYSNGCFSTTVKSSNGWWGNWWGSGSSTTYYLASSGSNVTVSTSAGAAAAAFFVEHEDELHTFDSVITDPTCTEDGYTTHTCVNCGYTYVNAETSMLGHEYEAVVTDPTCTEPGYTTHTCIRCGDSYVSDETAALDHSYEDVVTDPTCTESGCTTHTCIRCGKSYVTVDSDPLGHSDEVTEVVEPTCTEGGYTIYTCAVCGESHKGDFVDALGHNFVDGTCDKCGEADAPECVYLQAQTLTSGESYILTLGGKNVGSYTFTQVSGGWTIQTADGKYLAMENKTLVCSDTAFAWTYSNSRFSTTVKSSNGGFGGWWGSSSSTTYYLAASGSNVTVSTSTSAATAAFYQEVSGDHVYGDPVAKNGYHDFTCVNCSYVKSEACSDPDCQLCHPPVPEAVINVSVAVTKKSSGGNWWWGFGSGSKTTYTATITVTAENTEVESVSYSTDGGSNWTKGTSFTSSSEITAFDIRVIATNGQTYYFAYNNGTVTPATN